MKRNYLTLILLYLSLNIFAAENIKNLVVITSSKNLTPSEQVWLTDSVKDKLESNLKEYTDLQMISSNDRKIKELQRKSEGAGFDQSTSIELGKILSASHAVFLVLNKSKNGYTLSAELTNLSTGTVSAKCSAFTKKTTDELFNTAGCAVDELTIELCQKIGLPLTGMQLLKLKQGAFDIADTEQYAMAKQEYENYTKQVANINKEIQSLKNDSSNTGEARKVKLESERAIAEMKKKNAAETLRQLEEIEKGRREAEALNSTRTAEQRKRIMDAAKEANSKTAELRNLQSTKMTAFSKVKLLEAKKTAYISFVNDIEKEGELLADQYKKEYAEKIKVLKNAPWRPYEKNEDGTVSKEAIEERNNKVKLLESERDKKIEEAKKKLDDDTLETVTGLLTDILKDEEELLSTTFEANTINKNLRVKIKNYGREIDGWKITYTLLCEGIEIWTEDAVIKYDELEKIMASGIDKYDAIDMYDSLFKCGEPVLTFSLTYKVKDVDDEISKYEYSVKDGVLSFYNTESIKISKSGSLEGSSGIIETNKSVIKQMQPLNDFKGIKNAGYSKRYKHVAEIIEYIKRNPKVKLADAEKGIVEEKRLAEERRIAEEKIAEEKRIAEEKIAEEKRIAEKKRLAEAKKRLDEVLGSDYMIPVPKTKYSIGKTEVTQELYKKVTGENPSFYKYIDPEMPVNIVNYYDAVIFCNKLSILAGLTPVYKVKKSKDPDTWGYNKNHPEKFKKKIEIDEDADGFRLPTCEEWEYAARGGENYEYSGSANLDEVGWYTKNSGDQLHKVAKKKANGYGIYDMSGNVYEWCWDVYPYNGDCRYYCGGSYSYDDYNCEVDYWSYDHAYYRRSYLGFRIVCSASWDK